MDHATHSSPTYPPIKERPARGARNCPTGILRKNSTLLLAIHQLIDILFICAAFYAALLSRRLPFDSSQAPDFLIFCIVLACHHISLRLFGVYGSLRTLTTFQHLFSKVVQAGVTGTCGIIFIMYLLHQEPLSRLFLIYFTLFLLLFLCLSKAILFYTLRHNRARDYNSKNVLIIGTKSRAIDLIKEIHSNPGSGYRIHGCLDTPDQRDKVGNTVSGDVTVIGTTEDFSELLCNEVIDEIIFALPLKRVAKIHNHILHAEEMGINVRILPDFQIQRIMYYPETAKVYIDTFLGIPTMSLSSIPRKDTELFFKSLIDYTLGILGLLALSPLLLLIALTITMTSRGPILFTQIRSGLNGRDFTLYKFRTMVADAEALKEGLAASNEMDGPVFKIKDDPRITWIGHFLRKTSLDELPQLINILKGEMSFVGPRPPLPTEVVSYHTWQRRKLSMKPGLTCIWQVSGRNNISFEEWMRMDLEYIDNWSPLLDTKLFLMTIKEVLFSRGH